MLTQIKEKWMPTIQKFQHFLRNHRLCFYLIIISLFVVSMGTVFGLGLHNRLNVNVKPTALNKTESIADNTQYRLVRQEYNPKTQLWRTDLYFKMNDPSMNADEFQNRITADSIIKSQPSAKFKAKVIKVNPHYFVLYTEDIPANFLAMKTFVDYHYKDDGSNQKDELELFATDHSVKKNDHLQMITKKSILVKDAINYDIQMLHQNTSSQEKKIKKSQQKMKEDQKAINGLTQQSEYQLGEEKNQTENNIDQLKEDIQTEKENIKTYQSTIKLNQKKEALLIEKRKDESQKFMQRGE